MTSRNIVLGIGNILNKDEGLGVQALHLLEKELANRVPELELVDGGTLGLDLLVYVEDADHLLVLDAIDGGKTPGTVIELKREQIPLYSGVKLSQHQITFQEVLQLAQMRDHFPHYLHMIGAQPEDLSLGIGLSSSLEACQGEIVQRAIKKLREWNMIPEPI